MRGKVYSLHSLKVGVRITPAYAGKSCPEKCRCRQQLGSPPPMRGKAENLDKRIRANGITPAYAGKR